MKASIIQLAPLFVVALAVSAAGAAEMREWTRVSDGNTIRAEYAGPAGEGKIRLRMGSRVYEVPLESLSEEDVAYVEKQEEGDMESGEGKSKASDGPVELTLSGVHLCCGDCEETVASLAGDSGATTLEPDRNEGTVEVTATSPAYAKAILRKVLKAGFYGESDHETLAMEEPKEDDFRTSTLPVNDLHLCCGQCVDDFTEAVKSVEGVDEVDAEEGSDSAMVKGDDFRPYDVMVALREVGFGGAYR